MTSPKTIAAAIGKRLAAAFAVFTAGAGVVTADPGSVVATIKPIHSLVAAVMEGVGTPALLVPGSVSPHTFTMRPSEARLLDSASLVFWVGEGLEAFLTGNVGLAENATWIELSHAPGVELLPLRQGGAWPVDPAHAPGVTAPHIHSSRDPHFWLDPDNAEAATMAIAAALATADPANAALYEANAESYTARIAAIAADIEAELAPVRSLPFIVLHDGYQYFERRFGLNGVGAVVISPDIPPGARRIGELRTTLASENAMCAFSEPQYSSALMETLADGLDIGVGVLDSIGADIAPGAEQYPELIRRLGHALFACLSAAV